MSHPDHKRKHIVIIGGGIAGLAAAQELERLRAGHDEYNVTLIDKNCYHLYHALLYEVATAPMDIRREDVAALEAGMCVRIKAIHNILLRYKVNVIQGLVTGVDLGTRTIILENDSPVMYDELILALGSESNDFHIPGLSQYSTAMKELPDALNIHLKVDQLLHWVVNEKKPVHIIVGGGGVSGVEVASELRNYAQSLARKHAFAPDLIHVDIVEAGPSILMGLDSWVQAQALQRLQNLGVGFQLGQPITEVDEHYVTLKDGRRLDYDLIVWCGGIQGHHIYQELGVPLAGKRQVPVTPQLFIPGYPNVYVIGDGAFFIDPTNSRPVPQIAPLAVEQGRLAARNIFAHISGQTLKTYQPGHHGYVIPVGGSWAVSTYGGKKLSGRLAWLLRKWVDLQYLASILKWSDAWKVFRLGASAYLRQH